MITAPADYITALGQSGRHFDAKIIHAGSEVSCDIQNIKTSKGAQDGQVLSIGSVFSSSAEITCSGLSESLINEDITLKIGILLSDGTYSYITYGQFTVIKAPKTQFQTILSCVGFISSKFNAVLPDMNNPTLSAVASAIQTATGVTVTIPTTGAANTLRQPLTGVTCRTALAIIAFMFGGYATENASGGVEIHQYSLPQDRLSVLAENCLHAPVVSEETFTMTGIKVIVEQNIYQLTTDTTAVTGKTYYTRSGAGTTEDPYVYTEVETPSGNPASQGWYEMGEVAYTSGSPIRQTYISPYMTQAIFNVFAGAVVGLSFMPAEIDMSLGDPRLEPWDCLTVTDVDGTTIYTVPCHNLQNSFDGGFASVIQSIGEGESDPAVTGSISKEINSAVEQAADAQTAARTAKAAAAQAKRTTDEINAYATLAGKTVTQILQDGETAGESAQQALASANQAQQSASTAYSYASVAANQLSVVEDIVGVLSLVAENGTYARTQDETPLPDKWYFTRSGAGTTADPYVYNVQPNVNFEYVLTSDTSIVPGKPYYTRSGTGTEEDPYEYTPVETPVQADIGTYYEYTNWYYYELIGVDQAIQNYVSSHLVLVGNSLFLQTGSGEGSTRLELNTQTGVTLYDQTGAPVAQYGTDTIIGDRYGFHVKITSNRLSFYRGDDSVASNEVAYISGDKLYITQSVVLQQMDVGTAVADGGLGQWSWKVHEVDGMNNLYLKWLG